MLSSYSKIFVTGGSGWLGSELLRSLLNGLSYVKGFEEPIKCKIYCLLLPGEKISLEYPNIEVMYGDISNQYDCEKFLASSNNGLLFHLAGIIHPNTVKDFYRINLSGTKNLLEASVKYGLKRAVIMSSNSPNGVNPHSNHLFDEESEYNPYMNYGKSKYLMELAVKNIYAHTPLETVIIRSPWFYGPNQPQRQTLFFKLIQDGKFPLVGDGFNKRSMAYVENIVQGLLLASENAKANGQIFWIADDKPYTMKEIILTIQDLLEQEFGKKVIKRIPRIPHWIGEFAMYSDAFLQNLNIYNQKIHVLSEMNKNIACSTQKAKDILGYSPQINLYEGMRRSISWCINKDYL